MKKLMTSVSMSELKYETIADSGLLVYTAKTKYVWISDNVEYLIIAKLNGDMITITPEDAVSQGYILMKYPGINNNVMLTESEYNLVFIDGNGPVNQGPRQPDFKIDF